VDLTNVFADVDNATLLYTFATSEADVIANLNNTYL
jgi:hypothetical protein